MVFPASPDASSLTYIGPRFAMVPEWVLYHPGLQPAAKTVYAVLARHGQTAETCFPSHARIAELAGVSRSTVIRSITALEHVGAVIKTRRTRRDGSSTSNGYAVWGHDTPPTPPETAALTATTPLADAGPGCVTEKQGVCHRETGGVSQRNSNENQDNESQVTTTSVTPKKPVAASLFNTTPTPPPPDTAFDDWWHTYPRKVGKPRARRAWNAALAAGTTPNQIVDGLTLWANYWTAAGTQTGYIPHPTTWLNEHRWNDAPPPPPTVTRSRPPVTNERRAATPTVTITRLGPST